MFEIILLALKIINGAIQKFREQGLMDAGRAKALAEQTEQLNEFAQEANAVFDNPDAINDDILWDDETPRTDAKA